MNKKSMMKAGAVGIVVIIFILLFLIFLAPRTSSAVIERNQYVLGEKVKIDLGGFENYKMNIITPSNTYLKQGSKGAIIFQPQEAGKYKIEIGSGGKYESYEFEVINEKNATSILQKPNDTSASSTAGRIEKSAALNTTSGILQNSTTEGIVVGKPARWSRKFSVSGSILVSLPENSSNISVFSAGRREKIDFKVRGKSFRDLFNFFGNKSRDKKISIGGVNGEIEVEYFTPAPEKEEKIISEKEKEIRVYSDFHYENVTSYTDLLEIVPVNDSDLIEVYWKEENTYLGFNAVDSNNNGFIDRIEWNIPHLSNQTFDVYLKEPKPEVFFNFSSEKVYFSGERILFDMKGFGNYKLKIKTPVSSFSRVGSNDFFSLDVMETGGYTLELWRGGNLEKYEFQVLETRNEGEKIQGKAEINKRVKWIEILNNTEIEYYTEAPKATENIISELKKEVVISSPEGIEYRNVLAYTNLNEILHLDEKNLIRVYWKEENTYLSFNAADTNNNGLIDRVEWNVPHLSNQTFEIIIITKAVHLDENRSFIEDVYDYVKANDSVWKQIPRGHYLRVSFEANLNSGNDIIIYARGSGSVEVYEKDKNEKIADFGAISQEGWYKVYLTNLTESQDTFDLRVVEGDVEFDYVVDPVARPGGETALMAQVCAEQNNQVTQDSFPDSCSGSYPAVCSSDRLSCNDGTSETATSIRVTGTGAYIGYGGERVTVYNSTIIDCKRVSQVLLCYEFWGASSQHTCTVGVDSHGGSSFVNTDATCSATEPGATCINVTTSESWSCSNFFGASGTRAMAKAQALKTSGSGATTWTFDALQFNVTYTANSAPNTPSPSINSTDGTNYSNQNLNCYNTLLDADNDSMNVSLVWYKNGIANLSFNFTNSYSNGTFFNAVLGSGNLSTGENWSCSLRLYDGLAYSNWSNSSLLRVRAPPPSIAINSPANGTTVADVTPTLNVTLSSTADTLWYSVYNGSVWTANSTICTSCTGNQGKFLYLREGNFQVSVYANNSEGSVGVNSSSFTVNMNFNYYDTFDDNSSIITINNVTWSVGNVSFTGKAFADKNYNEGESMSLSGGYVSSTSCVCSSPSGSYCARHEGSVGALGNVSILSFPNSTGRYNITFRFCDENDDPSGSEDDYTVYVAGNAVGSVSSIAGGSSVWRTYSVVADISNGSSVTVGGIRGSTSTYARVDWANITEINENKFGNFTAYSINTTQNISRITNITWNEAGTESNNNITVQVSANGGTNWYNVANGQELSSIASGYSLIYRVLFNTYDIARTIYLLDMNIAWTNSSAPPVPAPNITINSPAGTVADVTPTLNVTLQGTADTLWYSVYNGSVWTANSTICTSCTGNQGKFLYLREGNFQVRVYANSTTGSVNSSTSNFTVNMNFNYYDTFDDNSSLLTSQINGVSWQKGNVSYTGTSSAKIKSVQKGSTTIDSGSSTRDVAISSVNLSSSFLVFSYTINDDEPGDALVWGNLSSSTNIHFESSGSQAGDNTAYIEWYVVEFESGVSVQGGTISQGATTNTAISAVNTSQTFPLISFQNNGVTAGTDDSVRARLTSSTNLETYAAASTSDILAWQVIDYAGAKIQNGTFDMSGTSQSVTINSVNLNKAIVIATWGQSGDLTPSTGALFVNFTSSTSLNFQRSSAGGITLYVAWYVVEFTGGERVQSGVAHFNSADSNVNIPISSINMSRAVVLLSGNQKGGMSPYSTADNFGVAWIAANITNSTNLNLTRALTGATADAFWQIVEFNSLTSGNFTAYPINTTATVAEISNVTWNEAGTDSNNNITVQVSANGGTNWYNAVKGEGITGIVTGASLVYRVIFNAEDLATFYLLDMNISWRNSTSPRANITYPTNTTYNINVSNLNYTVQFASSCKYTTNGGQTNTSITCGQNVSGLTPQQGSNTWTVYAAEGGAETSDSVTFFVDSVKPSINLNYPTGGGTYYASALNFSWNATDNLDSVLVCNLTVDSVVKAIVNSTNGMLTSFYAGGITSGSHLWNVTCWDDAGNVNTSETRSFTTIVQTRVRQIVKGTGVTSGAVTDVPISPALLNISRAFHFVSYSHASENLHADTYKSSEIINETTLRIYAAEGDNPVNFSYSIIEMDASSPTIVQRQTLTIASGSAFPINTALSIPVNTSTSFIISEGHIHDSPETTIGSEEYERVRLVNGTTWEIDVGSAPNTGPQYNRMEVVDWNDPNFIKLVQRNVTNMSTTSTTLNITPNQAVNPNNTLVLVTMREGNGNALTEPPSEVGMFTSLSADGKITIEREVAGPELSIAWQLIEFQTGKVKVKHITGSFANAEFAGNITIEPVGVNKSAAFGTVGVPFGHSSARASSTTGGAIDRNMFRIRLANSTAVEAIRGDATGTAKLGAQIWEVLERPSITNVQVVDITYSSARVIWDTDASSNSSVRYGTNSSTLSSNLSNSSLVYSHSINLTGLSTLTLYYFNVTSCNDDGCAESGIYNFTTLTGDFAPSVSLVAPNTSYIQNSSTVVLYYNATDSNDNIANATLILNGIVNMTNQSRVINGGISNFTIALADGVYNWTVNITDTTNLKATTSQRNFTIDTRKPAPILYNPSKGEQFTTTSIPFNFTVTDNLDPVLVCNLTVDSSVVEGNINVQNGNLTNVTKTVGIGTHFWNVTCWDDAGNLNTSETRNFTINDYPPVINLTSPDSVWTNISSVVFYYNVTDNGWLMNCSLYINGVFNKTNSSAILNGQINNFTQTLVDGRYNWTVNCTDNGGLTTQPSPKNFTLDATYPRIDLNLPSNGATSNSSSLSFNFTATDNLDSRLDCTLLVGERSDSFQVDSGNLTNRQISGLTDGLKYWNVTCWDDAGNRNVSQTRTVNITEYPRVQLNTQSGLFYNYSNIVLNYTPYDNTNLSRCELYLNGVLNQTNQSAVVNGAVNNFSTNLGSGFYNWSVKCYDLINLSNSSETRNFTLDLIKPSIQLLAPDSGATLSSVSVEFNFTVTDNIDTNLSCNLTVNGIVNGSFSAQNGSVTSRTLYFPTGGFKLWNVTCWDDAGNLNSSETRNFTLSFAPRVSLINPDSGYIQNSSTIVLYYTVVDDNNNIANATLVLNGIANITNQSEVINDDENNFTITLADGVYNWTVNATDTTGLSGSDTQRNFTIDTNAPNITLNNPGQNSNQTWNNITFNFTVTDNLASTLACDLYINGSFVTSTTVSNGTNKILYYVEHDGSHNWSVTCRDGANNTASSLVYNFSVEAPPNVTLNSPAPNYWTNSSTITFSYTPNDPIGLLNCSLYIDGAFNNTNNEPDNGIENSWDVSGIAEGSHNWTVECFDVDSNPYAPSVRIFYVDKTAPNMTLSSPDDNASLDWNDNSVLFNFTARDNLDTALTCNLTIDGRVNRTNILATSGAEWTRTISGFAIGTHLWNVTCWDTVKNINTSETRRFNFSLPDFMVNSSSIVLNVSEPKENENVMINATIYNLGAANSKNVLVRFYNGNPEAGGTQINGDTRINISGYSSRVVSIVWNATLGTSNIYVAVDPPTQTNGSFVELNESNNLVNKSAAVGGWEFVYGSVNSNSEYRLANSQNYRVIKWNATNFENGSIYVTDENSVIFWASLQAIGRNKTGGNTTNDFSDIDVLLNMTNFSDSVYKVYTNSGQIKNTSDFLVFNKPIYYVPIADSINNSNFFTGILWDTYNDTDGQYSQSDKESLVFAAKINKGKQGAFGNYDYEARVPAKLRSYRNSNSGAVAFYTELF